MKNLIKILFVIGSILTIVGFSGKVKNNYSTQYFSNNKNNLYKTSSIVNTFSKDKNKLDLDILEEKVNKYISLYDNELEISDIFIFENSDYYFSIIEKSTGMGAMELLINPYTGTVYPEYGPNMMWNQKYGMHNNSMMNGRFGMMGNSYYANNSNITRNVISKEDAIDEAKKYMDLNFNERYSISSEGHEFYGYYTFHIEENHSTIGMLSVNGYSGDVWYHTWHGKASNIIDKH